MKTHPFYPGDQVVLKVGSRRRYGEIACLMNCGSVLVRWTNGKTEQVNPKALTFNYGKSSQRSAPIQGYTVFNGGQGD
jgi:hypothetical protein